MQIEVHLKVVTEVLVGWRLVDHLLGCLSSAFIHDTPGEKTACGPVDNGYDIGSVFFRSMNVNSSSISATSTFPSGLGISSGNWSEKARAQLSGNSPLVIPIQVHFYCSLPNGVIIAQRFRLWRIFSLTGLTQIALTASTSQSCFDLFFASLTMGTDIHIDYYPISLILFTPVK